MRVPVRVSAVLVLAALGLAPCACGKKSGGPAAPNPGGGGLPSALHFDVIASGLSDPLFIASPPGDSRLFVVERVGRIRIIRDGTLLARPFLDIRSLVNAGGPEQGLLGLAFEPGYAGSGHFYVDYTDLNGDTRVVRYHTSSNPDSAMAADSVQLILTVTQPFANHNGGMLAFGPDGMLYVGLGDGGGSGDPSGNGQNTGVLLGKILRLDVRNTSSGYTSPADNPFAGSGRPEIWSYGLRNPWRFSFDRANGDLYVADVGQNQYEEIDVSPASAGAGKGVNFGWNRMEGLHCFQPASGCDTAGLALPVVEYSHAGGACSVIGGYVYRGSLIPGLRGHYLYADYCARWVRSFRWVNGQATQPTSWATLSSQPLSFGEDAAGELYIGLQSGEVVRVEP